MCYLVFYSQIHINRTHPVSGAPSIVLPEGRSDIVDFDTDILAMQWAIDKVRSIVAAAPLAQSVASETAPGAAMTVGSAELEKWVRHIM